VLSGLSLLHRRIEASLFMPKLTLETWLGSICTFQAMVHGRHATVGMEAEKQICMAPMRAAVRDFSVHISTK